ncbi:hypothetical protein [Pseudomonas typographi]|uniref:hypothetical protein n=1 Tax=Pseudomonas typographi TaxID=2715964 RepID=UPI0016867117|nr:hypothetical protein [Pseudomonas typographi]MBD1586723.1 hypothetical protein [Pseudomonas typographi]
MSRPTLLPEWRQAANDIAEGFKYGDLITLDWLREAFHLDEPKTIEGFRAFQFAFLSNMDSLRQELLQEHRLLLTSVRGVGYELIEPNEQVETAWQSTFVKVKRELTKLAGAIRHIRYDELSDDKRREHADAQAKLSGIHAFVQREGKRKQSLLKVS